MADSAELAFVKSHLSILGSAPVTYPDDYQQVPSNQLKKVPVIPLDLPPPPKPKSVTEIPDTISVIFKSTKPARTFTFPVALADPISSIKSQLALQPGAPPADAQRLLLRGKALSDVKLLQEYAIKDGDTITLMLRPGFEWDWGAAASSSGVSGVTSPGSSKGNAKSSLEPGEARPKHGRIPSVVLSPSPSTTSLPLAETPAPIPLTLDTKNLSPVTDQPKVDAYNKKVASPEFWDRLYGFLRIEFEVREDADQAFETFLVGSKGYLTPSEIARIRDTVGIMGMGGT